MQRCEAKNQRCFQIYTYNKDIAFHQMQKAGVVKRSAHYMTIKNFLLHVHIFPGKILRWPAARAGAKKQKAARNGSWTKGQIISQSKGVPRFCLPKQSINKRTL